MNERRKLKEEYPYSFIDNKINLKSINLYEKKKKDKLLSDTKNISPLKPFTSKINK